ncbi:MAG: antibiotic biosynthesis monooxygenase [Myxococcales bacterium]|nr:antibiotic biosynthesis monooxygenase [Myxococcales bacterium]MDH3844588.1 antibiotic biosynthesis monooxygenase [Myxococcales bacterium]
MTAYNVVRMRVKEGREQDFIDRNWQVDPELMKGLKRISIVSTGDRNYCLIGEWEDAEAIAGAGPIMISALDTFRDTLEDLGLGTGVTEAMSGEAVIVGYGKGESP